MKFKKAKITRRKRRVRLKIRRVANWPRLSVYRSNKFIYAQIIDDVKRTTLVSASERNLVSGKKQKEYSKTEKAGLVGKLIATKALKKGIKKTLFDRGPYRYHGRVRALAEGAREAGLKF